MRCGEVRLKSAICPALSPTMVPVNWSTLKFPHPGTDTRNLQCSCSHRRYHTTAHASCFPDVNDHPAILEGLAEHLLKELKMSEYWKSTPKYWCKHCKTFVRDTKFEKQHHEATGRHQGNLQRFLRGLHRGHEREERDKQRAKDEVDRLNGLTTGPRPVDSQSLERKPAISRSRDGNRGNDPADRKRQLAQLAEMGVAVPEDFRREMAMAGDWQTVSVTSGVEQSSFKDEGAQDEKKQASMAVGVRKRKADLDEDEVEHGGSGKLMHRSWASAKRSYPGADNGIDDDLDVLLNSTKVHVSPLEHSEAPSGADDGAHESEKDQIIVDDSKAHESNLDEPKTEKNEKFPLSDVEDKTAAPGFFFKKRKAKRVAGN